MIYDKLVRDKIIEIIKADGKEAKYKIAHGEEYKCYLIKKLQEEVDEFKEEEEIEELADILEVIEGLLNVYNLSWDDIFKLKEEKAIKRGQFEEGIILKEVKE
ncbi:nucleoside triphosphate pyrophosphohydrolase [Natroniella sulfidigena]|uniref:nucleoside triphosphate pyrophosphohydrolase n=1 Tax=Natroniella sulfidigena TaxID=723921 RepID=UPI00200BA0D7|nr:nucleoside triphosphate pyrophosphohydrolase [Natroniella sulfidigena]MCK8816869.1 nucleoside triphosphate pyrophosphohydrolase [Natroniella sulfidigena]